MRKVKSDTTPVRKAVAEPVPESDMRESLPKGLGAKCDLLNEKLKMIRHLGGEIKARKANAAELEEVIINAMQAVGTVLVEGTTCAARIADKTVYSYEDYDALRKYAVDHDCFDIFQRRLSSKAIETRIENGEAIPVISHTTDALKIKPLKPKV